MTTTTEDRQAAECLDTLNFCGVTAKDGRVLVLIPGQIVGGSLDPEDAIRAAAWLIVGAEMAGQERGMELTTALVERIRNT